jgi:RNA polymerase sigma factor for flagellar operon FliA
LLVIEAASGSRVFRFPEMYSTLPPPPSTRLVETLSVVDAVLTVVARRLPPYVSREDLASAGKVALVEALLRFEGPLEEARAYCYTRVRGAMLDELRRLDPLSRRTREQVTLVRRAAAALERRYGRAPTVGEVAFATGLTVEGIRHVERLAAAAELCSTDERNAEGELLHQLADAGSPCPARSAEEGDVSERVQAALARLPANHAHVLRRYYLDDLTLEEIAVDLGLSRERVRQIRDAAEERLRADIENPWAA